MKVAILSESPADEAAVRILLEGILGEPIETPNSPPLRSRGYTSLVTVLPTILKHLHYRSPANALVVVADSDNSPVHRSDHQPGKTPDSKCRTCRLISLIEQTQQNLRPSRTHPVIWTAVAVPTPSIEAWYLFEKDPDCSESRWLQKQHEGVNAREEILRLKRRAYGTERPGLSHEVQRATEHAHNLVARLDSLAGYFPNSFGLLQKTVQQWRDA